MSDYLAFFEALYDRFLAHPKRLLFFLVFLSLLVICTYWLPRLVLVVVERYVQRNR